MSLRLIWRALTQFLVCQHDHRYKERVSGRLMLTCDTCGDSVPALNRTTAERKRLLRYRPSHETMKARPAHPAKVISLGRAK